MTYMKNVNGVDMPCTPEEIAEIEAREAAWEAGRAKRDARAEIVRLEALIRENKVAGVPPYLHERHLREMKAEVLSFTSSDPDLLNKIQSIETQIATLRSTLQETKNVR